MFPQFKPAKTAPETPNERRHRLRRNAGAIMGEFSRVAGCGRKRIADSVSVVRTTGGNVQYHGLMTCGSIWQCPVCSSRIASKRAIEVQELLEAHDDAKGAVYMATFTVKHSKQEQCREVRDLVRDAWALALRGGTWHRMRQQYGVVGYVRSLELTHGQNGWHPHLHVLFFTKSPVYQEQFQADIWDRWQAAVEKLDGQCDIAAFDFRLATNISAAAEYVSKWGAGSEVSKGVAKSGRQGSRSPWQLLESAAGGVKSDVVIWKEYAVAMVRARHMTYSVGIRKLYGLGDENDDEQLALDTETIAREVYNFDEATWSLVVRQKLTGGILDAARSDDPFAIDKLLLSNGIGLRQRPTQYGHAPPANGQSSRKIRYVDWLGLSNSTSKTGTKIHA